MIVTFLSGLTCSQEISSSLLITGISAGTSKTLSMSGDLNGIITNEDGNLIGTFTRTDTTTSVIPSTLGISFSSDGTIQNLSGSIVNVTAYQSLN